MRGGLDRLQREIDTLTYNARSVLNGLIHSVLRASGQNFKFIRLGHELSLDRVGIYRVYEFYRQWEAANFSQDLFTEILAECDMVPVKNSAGEMISSATTPALIVHSKILHMNPSNVGRINEDSYWLGLIQNNNTPKLLANSAPIPVNLRTPVFDPNLSTTHYNQQETFLLPSAYYMLDLYGFENDHINHYLNGMSWTIRTDSYASIECQRIMFGGTNPLDTKKTYARRVGTEANLYTTVWGYNTHARGPFGTAGGNGSIVPESVTTGVAIGEALQATANYAGAFGGQRNTAAGLATGVLGGYQNFSVAQYSGVLAGVNNVTGGATYAFKFPTVSSTLSDMTFFDKVTGAPCVVAEGSATAGGITLLIKGNVENKFNANDTLTLHSFTRTTGNKTGIHASALEGDSYKSMQVSITSVGFVPITASGNAFAGNTVIQVSVPVYPGENIDGGYLTLIRRQSSDNDLGYSSAVMGLGNIASGYGQTVVGNYNEAVDDTVFLVGHGTSDYLRANAIEVFSDPGLGIILNGDRFYIDGNKTGGGYEATTYIQGTRLAINSQGIFEYGTHAISTIQDGSIYSAVGAEKTIGMSLQYNAMCGVDIFSRGKYILIENAGRISHALSGYDIGIKTSGRFIATSQNGTIISSLNSYIAMYSYLDLSLQWNRDLVLIGDTFGALTATDSQFGHRSRYIQDFTESRSTRDMRGIARAGFYDLINPAANNTFVNNIFANSIVGSRLIDRALMLNVSGNADSLGFVSWKMIFPVIHNLTGKIPNPAIEYDEIDAMGNVSQGTKNRGTEKLAFLSDVGAARGTWTKIKPEEMFSKVLWLQNAEGSYTDEEALKSAWQLAEPDVGIDLVIPLNRYLDNIKMYDTGTIKMFDFAVNIWEMLKGHSGDDLESAQSIALVVGENSSYNNTFKYLDSTMTQNSGVLLAATASSATDLTSNGFRIWLDQNFLGAGNVTAQAIRIAFDKKMSKASAGLAGKKDFSTLTFQLWGVPYSI
jgi:hypothetical protein